MSIEFRPYQKEIIQQGVTILKRYNILYLSMEVRTGKTLTALGIAYNMDAVKILFITKKKAISSIQSDHKALNTPHALTVMNYESLHKLPKVNYDVVIVDEAHSLGAYPKPSKRTREIKKLVGARPVILLSGTPTPESYSQIFHQFFISSNSPFPQTNFYKWAGVYVDIKKVYRSYGTTANDYSNAKMGEIKKVIAPYMISYTQQQAGFTTEVKEEILTVQMLPSTYDLVNKLERDLVFEGKNGGVILADTPVKLLNKITQIYSGTVKLEDGNGIIIDRSKAEFIKNHFHKEKIGIFYKYKAEWDLLKQVFGFNLTNDLEEFNTTDKNIALQVVSGREGISLKNAKYLVMFNICHSATSYWQSRDRMQTMDRLTNNVYWIFAKGGIEHSIYKTVLEKKNYTTSHYKKRLKNPEYV